MYGMGEYCRSFVSGRMPSPNSTQNETRETEKSWVASLIPRPGDKEPRNEVHLQALERG